MIETQRLILRPMRAEDTDPLLRVFGDPLVMASFGAEPFDRSQMREWVQRNLDHQVEHRYGLFTVILRQSGDVIGDCGLERMEIDGVPAAELGYDLQRDVWNRGLATEAAAAVRDYGFRTLHLPRLVSLIRQGNIASRRVAEKIGMHHLEAIDRSGIPYWLFGQDRPVKLD